MKIFTVLTNTILGIPIDKGYHEIELKYIPPLFYMGLFISSVGMICFILLIVLQ
jgi:uncharacterized membrane protein YfhO